MADIIETTTCVNTAGAENHNVPAWTRQYFEQQTKLMEKLLEATTAKKSQGKRSIQCYKCGKFGIIKANAGGMEPKETPTIRETPTGRGLSVRDSARAAEAVYELR